MSVRMTGRRYHNYYPCRHCHHRTLILFGFLLVWFGWYSYIESLSLLLPLPLLPQSGTTNANDNDNHNHHHHHHHHHHAKNNDSTIHGMVQHAFDLWQNDQQEPQQQPQQEGKPPFVSFSSFSCALHFHGLPRAFTNRVLPSIIRHVLIPNARYQCDVFGYYHYLTHEAAGRSGHGGRMDPQAIQSLLPPAVQQVTQEYLFRLQRHERKQSRTMHIIDIERRNQTVIIQHYTNADFERERGEFLQKTHLATNSRDGRPLYIPWRAGFDQNTSDNIIRMWHGIQGSWNLMTMHQQQQKQQQQQPFQYKRVAFFRADVVYTTSIDIWTVPLTQYSAKWYHTAPLDYFKWPKTSLKKIKSNPRLKRICDVDNAVAVIPAFSPVNDRLIYGPYPAVELWATRRFAEIDDHVQEQRAGRGYGLHDEKFLKYTIFPRILQLPLQTTTTTTTSTAADTNMTLRRQEQQRPIHHHQRRQQQRQTIDIQIDPTLCFIRARSDGSLWVNDCGGNAHATDTLVHYNLQQIQAMFQTTCHVESWNPTTLQAICSDQTKRLEK